MGYKPTSPEQEKSTSNEKQAAASCNWFCLKSARWTVKQLFSKTLCTPGKNMATPCHLLKKILGFRIGLVGRGNITRKKDFPHKEFRSWNPLDFNGVSYKLYWRGKNLWILCFSQIYTILMKSMLHICIVIICQKSYPKYLSPNNLTTQKLESAIRRGLQRGRSNMTNKQKSWRFFAL